MWDTENFSSIAGKFGKVINPFDTIENRPDYSMGKVGVLTSYNKWINEHVKISCNGVVSYVGVVEYTDDWSPFTPQPFDQVEELDEDDNNSENTEEDTEDMISDTWMEDKVGEVDEVEEEEEGEFRPDETHSRNAQENSPVINSPQNNQDNNTQVQSPIRAAQPPQANEPLEGLNEFQQLKVNNNEATSPETSVQAKDGTTDIPIAVNSQTQDKGPMAESEPKTDFGPVQDLVPLGCFGPFPGVPPDIHITPISHPEVETSNATAADKIAEIGQAVGFQIEPDNPSLKENTGDNGEHIGIQ
ncbi:hypothetical protein L1887_17919 [Cichorium endivia]|nr:hypothetical protein L1887_17919 [Cichorium endivia]